MIRKTFRLWGIYARLDLNWILQDYKYCLTVCISEILMNIGSILGIILLAERFNGIGVWSKPQLLFFLGYGMTIRGLLDTFFNFNVLHISRRISRGQLDHSLIQPQSLILSFFTEGFIPFTGSWALIFGIGLVAYSLTELSLKITALWVFAYLLSSICSALIVLSAAFIIGSFAFYAPAEMEEVGADFTYFLLSLSSFPLDGLSKILQGILITILPVGMISWFPSRFLIGLQSDIRGLLVLPVILVILGSIAIILFKRGLKQYAYTGSQRYSALGHRG